jgi:phosphoribosylformylglycinamidine synthase I
MPVKDKSAKVLVIGAPGINRDEATKVALEMVGARAEIVPIMALREKSDFTEYQAVMIPGGFSYGDHIQSGRVLAIELRAFLKEQLSEHVFTRKRPVLGVCNGFQVLVQLGLLPFGEMGRLDEIPSTLTANIPAQFQSRWISMISQQSKCQYVPAGQLVTFPVAHGEGRYITDEKTYDRLRKNGQIVFTYCDPETKTSTETYPLNPNGSPQGIAGICDETGLVFGMMPHSEDFIRPEHHPNWRRNRSNTEPDGLVFFRNLVESIQ